MASTEMIQEKQDSALEFINNLSFEVKRRVFALQFLQGEHSKIEDEFQKELLLLEEKYHKMYQPLYEKRANIVDGSVEPTDEDISKVDTQFLGDMDESKTTQEQVMGVPEFWLTALKNHAQFSELITERDEEPLKQLKNITLNYLENHQDFTLSFEFSENEYFSNTALTKTYCFPQHSGCCDDQNDCSELEKSVGTKIEWKEGKDLTSVVKTKKQRHRGTQKTREVKKTVPAPSFFSFFKTIAVTDDVVDIGELEEELEMDIQLGEEFRDKIIPYACDWFTGKALQDDDMSFYDDNEDEFEDSDEDVEESDGSVESGDDVPQRKDEEPQCKQQ